jgi:lysophospholipase L1-like esterase
MAATRAGRPISLLLAVALTIGVAPAVLAVSDPAAPIPATMAAVGDSITRAASTGGSLGTDYPANSWATGTNSTVASHLLRLQGLNAATSATNLAVSGAKVAGLAAQLEAAAQLQPDYLTVLIGGNDICTPTETGATGMTEVADFRAAFEDAVGAFSAASPETHIYVVSIPRVLRLWELFKGNWWARTVWSIGKVCQSLLARPTSTNQADVDRRARVHQRNIDFNTQLAQVCQLTPKCHWDNNAVFNYTFVAAEVSGDYFHPSTAGQAKLASVSWGAGFTWLFPEGQEPASRVASLSGTGAIVSSRNWRATITIGVSTPAGAPLSGATVTGSFVPSGGSKSCTTNSAGTCVLTSNDLRRSSVTSVTFSVTGIAHATHPYDADDNLVTAVTVTRP